MKLKALVKLVERILGMRDHGDEPRADMYLPDFLLAFGLILIGGGLGFAVSLLFVFEIWMIAVAVVGVLVGTAAVLCWRNQTIHVLSDEKFAYTTFLGNTYEYAFQDITALRQNQDSLTLFIGKKKVHIESMAIVSDRLIDAVNEVLLSAHGS